jgi:hypothetical protein
MYIIYAMPREESVYYAFIFLLSFSFSLFLSLFFERVRARSVCTGYIHPFPGLGADNAASFARFVLSSLSVG